MSFENMLFDASIYIYYMHIHSPIPEPLQDPPHAMINECNPLTELITSIEHFSSKTYATDGRSCREKFTHTGTNIKRRKKQTKNNKHKTQNIDNNKQNYLGQDVNMDLNSIAIERVPSQSPSKSKQRRKENKKKAKDNSRNKNIDKMKKGKAKKKGKSKNPDKEENDDPDEEEIKVEDDDILGPAFDFESQNTYDTALDNLNNEDPDDDVDDINDREMFDKDRNKNKNKRNQKKKKKKTTQRRSVISPHGKTATRRSRRLNAELGGDGQRGRVLVDPKTLRELDDQEYPAKLDAFLVCHLYLCILYIPYIIWK